MDQSIVIKSPVEETERQAMIGKAYRLKGDVHPDDYLFQEGKTKTCMWPKCKRDKMTTFYCRLHHLAKEAGYALNDLDPKKEWKDKAMEKEFHQWATKRLVAFTTYVIDKDII